MTSLPLPASRPSIKSRAMFAFTPGLSPSYQERICFTLGVTRIEGSPEILRRVS
jgi:hypothetical protein